MVHQGVDVLIIKKTSEQKSSITVSILTTNTTDVETATLVGKRRDSNPVILSIDTAKASSMGINFYVGNEKVWFCDFVPMEYIETHQ